MVPVTFTLIAGVIFVVALVLAAIIWVGERREGHAKDD